MKNHLKKFIVFAINATIVLVGVFLIRNHEKNKFIAETNILPDPQTQNQEVEANLSELKEIEPASIANDAVNQANSSVSNAIDNTNLQPPPVVTPVANKPSPSTAPASNNSSSNSSSKKASTPKTKTS